MLIGFGYQDIRAGNTNLLAVKSTTGNWGFVNLKNDTIIPFQYNNASGFINSNAIVGKGALGMININGEIVIPLEFSKIDYADKNIVKVYKDDKYGFYNLNGQKLTNCIYDEIDHTLSGHDKFFLMQVATEEESIFGKFTNDYALVGINGRLGAINKKGI